MKWLAILFILLAGPALASPSLVCDPQAGVQYYILTGPAWVPTTHVLAQPDGSLKLDVATATIGTSNLTVKACSDDPIWASVCSTAVNFTLVRPSPPLSPLNIKLVP